MTDGVFAIALTLIVLEIRVPDGHGISSERELFAALGALLPRFLTYALSFLTLTIFWFGQQTQHRLMRGADRRLGALHLCFLAFVGLLPFSTDLLAEFIEFRASIFFYWLNLLFLGVTLFLSWRYAHRHGMVEDGADVRAVYQRIVKAQVLWAVGALLSVASIRASLGFLLVVQVVYASHPSSRWVRRIIG